MPRFTQDIFQFSKNWIIIGTKKQIFSKTKKKMDIWLKTGV